VFGGVTYSEELDGDGLRAQLAAVKAYVLDCRWHTLGEIEAALGYPQASISARLRDLRKKKFGGYTVLRYRLANGLHQYLVVMPVSEWLAYWRTQRGGEEE
jgi:hypothetical protein